MKKEFIIVGTLLTLGVIGAAVISSYGSITGYTTVNKAIYLDIIGSSNDDNYTLYDVEQGETKFSPKIKINNKADVPILVNLTVSKIDGADITLVNEFQNETLENPVNITPNDLYFYVKHYFYPNITPGNYSFTISVTPS